MKKLVVLTMTVILAAVLLCACTVENHTSLSNEPTSAMPASIASFSGLDEFLTGISATRREEDFAELSSLEYFYVPIGLPEGYTLYKINAAEMDIGFYYLPSEVSSSSNSAISAEAKQEHFKFISSRGNYDFESMMDQFDVTTEDLMYGKYIIHETTRKMVIWEEDGTVLMLYLPKGYVIDNWNTIFATEKYVKNEHNEFQKVD